MSNAKRRHRRRYRWKRQWALVRVWTMFDGRKIRIFQHRRVAVLTSRLCRSEL
jgi:hypothetical protein